MCTGRFFKLPTAYNSTGKRYTQLWPTSRFHAPQNRRQINENAVQSEDFLRETLFAGRLLGKTELIPSFLTICSTFPCSKRCRNTLYQAKLDILDCCCNRHCFSGPSDFEGPIFAPRARNRMHPLLLVDDLRYVCSML